jgi:hypothetical protein
MLNDLYVTEKVVITAAKLLLVVRDKIHFSTRTAIIMKRIGFKWKKYNTKRFILIENPEIVSWYHSTLCK